MHGDRYRDFWPKEWPDWPEEPRARKAVESSFELGLSILNAPASLRKYRLEQEDERAQYCWSQMAVEDREQVKALVDLWEQNALLQQTIRYEEEKKGLHAVEHLRTKWDSAGEQMRQTEEEALQLGSRGNEYFRSRVEQFHIVQEEKDEVGRYRNHPDYSELREQWYSGKPITAPLPWPWDDMLRLCKRFEAKGPKTKERSTGSMLAIASLVVTIFLGVAGIAATIMFGWPIS